MSEQNNLDNEKRDYNYIDALGKDPVNNLTAALRPLFRFGASDDFFLKTVETLGNYFLANNKEAKDSDHQIVAGLCDRLRWAINRCHVYEDALVGLGVLDLTNVELAQLLDGRSDVLYRLFRVNRPELSNEEIIEVLKQSSDPRVTDGLYFSMSHHRTVIHYPSLIKEFLDKVDKWEDDRAKIFATTPVKEPEMLEIDFEEPRGDDRGNPVRRTRRWIRREWLEWHQYQHGSTGRGCSYEESINAAIEILTKQLFPEGKPVDVQVLFDSYARDNRGYEVTIRRIVTNAEYF